MAWLSLVLSYGGFLSLALAMPRHHEEILGRKAGGRSRPLWRLAGVVLIALSLLPALRHWPNLAIGISAWLGLLTVAAFTLAMMLTYGARAGAAGGRLALFGLPVAGFALLAMLAPG